MSPGYHKHPEENYLSSNDEYRTVIGMLLYASCNSRPDISATVNILSQRISQPRLCDLQEAIRTAKYLKQTKHLALRLHNPSDIQEIIAWSDADHGENRVDRRSNSGVMIFANGGLMHWTSKKQSLVHVSTCDAEMFAIHEAMKPTLWLIEDMKFFGVTNDSPTVLKNDNQAAISNIVGNNFAHKSKHLRLCGQATNQ